MTTPTTEPQGERKPVPVRSTVKAVLNGWPVELTFDLPLDALPRALARLSELGATPQPSTPVVAPTVPAAADAPAKPVKVEPWFNAQGDACCPIHKKKLKVGRHGLYCSAKVGDDYCDFTA